MTPVMQTKTGKNGNCFQACVASILDMPLGCVPDFRTTQDGKTWFEHWQTWLNNRGFHMLCIEDRQDPMMYFPGYFILQVQIREGVEHAVVAKGNKIIHDPFPADHPAFSVSNRDDWLLRYHIIPLNPTWKEQ